MQKLLQPDRKRVGSRIRTIKDELGSSLTELGNRLGIMKSTLNSYVQGYSLAPEEIIEKLSKISGKPAEWFYYGEPSEYIRDYLILKGNAALLEEFAHIPFDIERDFNEKRRENPEQFETPYPDEEIIDIWFPEYYNKAMNQYILRITREFIEQQTDCESERKDEIITLIGRELYDSFDAVGYFDYGDAAIIQKDAKEIYERKFKGKDRNEVDLKDPYLIGALISSLGDDIKTADVIRILSEQLTGKSFNPSFGGKELIEIFKAMRPALMKLYAKTTSDELYDWFEEK